MANLSKYLTDSNVESYFESAIFDSRFIKGMIDIDGILILSKKENEKFRMRLIEDYYKRTLKNDIYFIKIGNRIIYTYQYNEFKEFYKHQNIECFKLDFESLVVLLFVNEFGEAIGYRRALIIARNAIYDDTEELIEYLGLEEKTYVRFLNCQYELEDKISLKAINDFYNINFRTQKSLSNIKLERLCFYG